MGFICSSIRPVPSSPVSRSYSNITMTSWSDDDHDSVSNHQPHGCLLNRLFRQIKEKIKAPRHWPLCGEFTGAGEFPTQRASCAENVSIWWRHHEVRIDGLKHNICLLENGDSYTFFKYTIMMDLWMLAGLVKRPVWMRSRTFKGYWIFYGRIKCHIKVDAWDASYMS